MVTIDQTSSHIALFSGVAVTRILTGQNEMPFMTPSTAYMNARIATECIMNTSAVWSPRLSLRIQWTYRAHWSIFSSFCLIPCSRLSRLWLPVSFSLHVTYTVSYCTGLPLPTCECGRVWSVATVLARPRPAGHCPPVSVDVSGVFQQCLPDPDLLASEMTYMYANDTHTRNWRQKPLPDRTYHASRFILVHFFL